MLGCMSLDPTAWTDTLVATEPNRVLLETAGGEIITYANMQERSGRIAAALVARDVKAGDRVVAQVEKSPDALMLYWACLRLGAVYVPLNTAYTPAEVDYFLNDSEAQIFVTESELRGPLAESAQKLSPTHFSRFSGGPDDLAAILYTSGTTGRSKGAMLTRRNLASNAEVLVQEWRFTKADTLLHALPIFHTHGLFVGFNTVIASGARILFLPKFDADEVLRLLPRATAMMGVPTFYTRLLSHPGLTREATRHLRLFVSGSAPLLAETHRGFEARTGHAILERYGMTETMMNTSNPYQGPRIPGTVGRALPGIEIRVADPTTGKILSEPDAIGVLEVKGPNVFRGYFRAPEKTAAEFSPDGFFITGDLGKIDSQGYVTIVGRGKDLIITGGFNVYPKEVEQEIDRVQGVLESAVIGLKHPDFGEGVTAVVVKGPGATIEESDILRGLEKRLAKFKLPKQVLFVKELPRNAMGKVQKKALRDFYADLYR